MDGFWSIFLGNQNMTEKYFADKCMGFFSMCLQGHSMCKIIGQTNIMHSFCINSYERLKLYTENKPWM